jgi:hypothetical protein
MAESVKDKFMTIPPRHQRALELLAVIARQPNRDIYGAIGVGALRDEDEPFTLEQIVQPLWERGLIEDLTGTELRTGGKYFVRITALGIVCLGLGMMLRDARKVTEAEIKGLQLETPSEADERAAIEDEQIAGTA